MKERHLAEIKYKTGLCHYTAGNYDQSIEDLQKSADYMQQSIEAQKKLEQTPAVEQLIDDLTKTREDIMVKIADVQETKQLVNGICLVLSIKTNLELTLIVIFSRSFRFSLSKFSCEAI